MNKNIQYIVERKLNPSLTFAYTCTYLCWVHDFSLNHDYTLKNLTDKTDIEPEFV